MPRAVLDTSVLVSAFLTPGGHPAKVVRAATDGAFVLCLSPEILAELQDALRKLQRRQPAFHPPADAVARYVRDLSVEAELVRELPPVRVVERDPKDDMIVATALAARADYLISGDRDLLDLAPYAGIRILTARAFLERLR